MSRVIFWGTGSDYEQILNQILFEIHKGNIEVVAVVSAFESTFATKIDSFRVISKDELGSVDFDYLIITSSKYYSEIMESALALGIPKNKIISGSVFSIRAFDFGLYTNLIEHPISIISDDCWGGFVYNSLSLPFSSPFINTSICEHDYLKLLSDFHFFMGTSLTPLFEGDLTKGLWPVGQLGIGADSIKISFPHSANFDSAYDEWSRRLQRINYENLFFKFSPCSTGNCFNKCYSVFSSLKEKKIMFSFNNSDLSSNANLYSSKRFVSKQLSSSAIQHYRYKDYILAEYSSELDILKLLNGHVDYSRFE